MKPLRGLAFVNDFWAVLLIGICMTFPYEEYSLHKENQMSWASFTLTYLFSMRCCSSPHSTVGGAVKSPTLLLPHPIKRVCSWNSSQLICCEVYIWYLTGILPVKWYITCRYCSYLGRCSMCFPSCLNACIFFWYLWGHYMAVIVFEWDSKFLLISNCRWFTLLHKDLMICAYLNLCPRHNWIL